MLTFSPDPNLAEQQMTALIFYLTAFGYVDGNFDFTEKAFVRVYIRQLVTARAEAAMPTATPGERAAADEVIERFVATSTRSSSTPTARSASCSPRPSPIARASRTSSTPA